MAEMASDNYDMFNTILAVILILAAYWTLRVTSILAFT